MSPPERTPARQKELTVTFLDSLSRPPLVLNQSPVGYGIDGHSYRVWQGELTYLIPMQNVQIITIKPL